MSDHESETKQEGDSNSEIVTISVSLDHFIGKGGTIWRKTPFPQKKTRAENIFVVPPKLTEYSTF